MCLQLVLASSYLSSRAQHVRECLQGPVFLGVNETVRWKHKCNSVERVTSWNKTAISVYVSLTSPRRLQPWSDGTSGTRGMAASTGSSLLRAAKPGGSTSVSVLGVLQAGLSGFVLLGSSFFSGSEVTLDLPAWVPKHAAVSPPTKG